MATPPQLLAALKPLNHGGSTRVDALRGQLPCGSTSSFTATDTPERSIIILLACNEAWHAVKMVTTKTVAEDGPQDPENPLLRKRSVDDAAHDVEPAPTKRRRRSTSHQELPNGQTIDSDEGNIDVAMADSADAGLTNGHSTVPTADEAPTVTPRKRGRPRKVLSQATTPSKTPTKSIFATPVKGTESASATPIRQAADRSARKKTVRSLIENVVGNGVSDDEQEDEDTLAREIYDSDADDDDDDDDRGTDDLPNRVNGDGDEAEAEAATPSKTGRRKGRPRKTKSPTPPRDLPPHELYFTHNKPGKPKTSDNTLASLSLLTHDEYFTILHAHEDRHSSDIEHLENLHVESFPQWSFELSQGYSICLFGFGSKRKLLQRFANHLHTASHDGKPPKIVIVNGYAHTTTMREVLSCVSGAIDPSQKIATSTPAAMVQGITSLLSTTDMTLAIIINSIDAPSLRKPGMQSILAQLAAHPQVNLVCSADTPDFSLLWDIGVRSSFNFAFHDCTTFAPFTVELDVIDEVHELLGRKARRVNGREGVAFVLKSLPENAKNLFRLLVGEVLIAMEEEGNLTDEAAGVEYRMVYNKAVEEFVCSSEMAFRTLLKEYVAVPHSAACCWNVAHG